MEITVYTIKGGGGYVLVPACFLPSNACEKLYGPMALGGTVTAADAVTAAGWERVIGEIDRHGFALLGTEGAQRLLGADHACLDSRVRDGDARIDQAFGRGARPRRASTAAPRRSPAEETPT